MHGSLLYEFNKTSGSSLHLFSLSSAFADIKELPFLYVGFYQTIVKEWFLLTIKVICTAPFVEIQYKLSDNARPMIL